MDTFEKYKSYVNTGFVASVEPIVVDRAEGAQYIAKDGSVYLDCFSGISVANAGHGNKKVIEAAKTQMDKLVHCCSYVYHVEPVADLAEKLALSTPGKLQKSFFANSGAEAIEGAMRLAKRYTGKREMVALTHSFHGRTYAALSVTGNSGRKKGGGPYMPGVAFSPAPYCYRCPFRFTGPDSCGRACAEYLDDVIKYHLSGDCALFIAEPIMGEGGILAPPKDFFKVVKSVLDMHGALLVADEVQSGFGRTGRLFAIEHYQVEPDIMTMAKGIADGFPLAAFISSREIADAFEVGDHLSTFGGNPVSCAASLANIDFLLEEDIPGQAAQKGDWLMRKLNALQPSKVVIGEVRGKGLMVGLELVKDAETREPATAEAVSIRAALRENGVLIGVGGAFGNVLRIQPPLTIETGQLERLVDALDKIL